MSTVYQNSSNIKVFPCARRPDHLKDSRELTEENLAASVKNSLGNFVCSNDSDLSLSPPKIKFFLGGYYFDLTGIPQTNTDNIYAHIKLYADNTYNDLGSMDNSFVANPATNLDFNSKFYGISFDGAKGTDPTIQTLKILSRASSSSPYTIPEESKLNLDSDIVDGGII